MNGLEKRYAENLELKKLAGEIREWQYEPDKIKLAYRCTYTPDFKVLAKNGTIEYHETKGFMRDDANVKLKVAAQVHPEFKFILVKLVRGHWTYKTVRRDETI